MVKHLFYSLDNFLVPCNDDASPTNHYTMNQNSFQKKQFSFLSLVGQIVCPSPTQHKKELTVCIFCCFWNQFCSPSTRILNWILHNSLQIAKYELQNRIHAILMQQSAVLMLIVLFSLWWLCYSLKIIIRQEKNMYPYLTRTNCRSG